MALLMLIIVRSNMEREDRIDLISETIQLLSDAQDYAERLEQIEALREVGRVTQVALTQEDRQRLIREMADMVIELCQMKERLAEILALLEADQIVRGVGASGNQEG